MEASEVLLDKQRDFHEEDASSSDKSVDTEWWRSRPKGVVD